MSSKVPFIFTGKGYIKEIDALCRTTGDKRSQVSEPGSNTLELPSHVALFLTVTKSYNSKNTAIRLLHAEKRAEANWLHVL